MQRAIEACVTIALCIVATSCARMPVSRDETSGAPAPEPESEAAAPEAVPEQPEIPVQPGPGRENLTCFSGDEDRQARIGVELVDGQVTYFAYYSKWRPRTCSLEAGRSDPYSRWTDNGAYSRVFLADEKGELRIEYREGAYRFAFIDVDRGRYCGMEGKINGSLTVTRGKSSCDVQGVMDGHEL